MRVKSENRFSISQIPFRKRISTLALLLGAGAAFLLTIVFGIVYYRQMLKDYRSEIQSHLRDTDTVFNSYLENTVALTKSMYSSSEGTRARLEKDYDFVDHYSYLNYARNLMTFYGYVHSVYFINQEGNISLWTKVAGSYTKDLDRELLNAQLYGRTESPFVWKLPYRYDENEVTMLSFFFSELPVGMENYTGTVIVNVELTELRKHILNENNSSREMFIVNKEGIVILHSNPFYIGEDWSDKVFVEKAVHGETIFDLKEEGHFEYICVPSQRNGFYLIAKSDYTGVSVFGEAFLIVPMICLALIIIMAILSALMGKHLARPITSAIEEIRQSSMGERIDFLSADESDELGFLQNYASHVNQYMEKVLENDQKNRVIYNLIRNDRNVDIQPFLVEKGILSTDTKYCVVTVEFVCQYEVSDIEELNSIRRSITKQYENVLVKYGHCTSYEHGLRYLLFLISEEKEAPIQTDILCEELQKSYNILRKENALTDIYTAVSRCLESSVSCKSEVRRNNERMEARIVYGKYGVEFVREKAGKEKPSEKTVESCIQALKNGDRNEYLTAVNGMIKETEDVSYPQFVSWVVDATEKIREVKVAMHRSYVKPEKSIVYSQVQLIHDLVSLRQWFEVLFDDVNEKMEQIRSTSTVNLIEDAVDYILQNFGDSQLGAVMLADKFHISAKYFGQLFMEFTGKGVSDYIIQIRMEKARNYLLARPDLEIMEVAKKVGYHSASYFSTAFKKYYGVTPSQFRSNLNINEPEE